MTPSVDWWVSLIQAFIVINLVMVTFAYLTLAERKVMGRMQLRYGPNRAGPFGLLQSFADFLKYIVKEIVIPAGADKTLFLLAPMISLFNVSLSLYMNGRSTCFLPSAAKFLR